jgi:hypothetical protein
VTDSFVSIPVDRVLLSFVTSVRNYEQRSIFSQEGLSFGVIGDGLRGGQSFIVCHIVLQKVELVRGSIVGIPELCGWCRPVAASASCNWITPSASPILVSVRETCIGGPLFGTISDDMLWLPTVEAEVIVPVEGSGCGFGDSIRRV